MTVRDSSTLKMNEPGKTESGKTESSNTESSNTESGNIKSGNNQSGNSQNFLMQIRNIFVTLGLKILGFLRLKYIFEADIIKGWC